MPRKPRTRPFAREFDIREYLSDALRERFYRLAVKGAGDDACWLWRGHGPDSNVYPMFQITKGVESKASRISWALSNGGVIPEGTVICHRCDTPPCVRPSHLFSGSQRDNVHDSFRKARSRHKIVGWVAPTHQAGWRSDTPSIGETHRSARLTEAQVREIRAHALRRGLATDLARVYGVTRQSLEDVLHYRSWKHVT